ncbi:MAG: HAD family phosphatase [Planctomycetes bacterium]|nr:HAD family phosphatase [Planctomycetota bacterium]
MTVNDSPIGSRPRRIRAVVFDLDGLMFNTEDLYQGVGTELLRRRDRDFPPELLDRMMGRPGRVSLQIMIDWHQLTDTVEQLQLETEQIFEGILDTKLATMPGLIELLASLEAVGIPKAIATSSGRRFATNVLGKFTLEPRFSFVMTSEDVTDGKPHPEIYLKAAHRLQIAPHQMMVLEDSQNGCRAAVAAGAVAVAVPGGHSLRHDFAGAMLVADSLADHRIYELLEIPRTS